MAGNQKLVVFNLAIIFPIFVLAAPRDGSSPDLDQDLGARVALVYTKMVSNKYVFSKVQRMSHSRFGF